MFYGYFGCSVDDCSAVSHEICAPATTLESACEVFFPAFDGCPHLDDIPFDTGMRGEPSVQVVDGEAFTKVVTAGADLGEVDALGVVRLGLVHFYGPDGQLVSLYVTGSQVVYWCCEEGGRRDWLAFGDKRFAVCTDE